VTAIARSRPEKRNTLNDSDAWELENNERAQAAM